MELKRVGFIGLGVMGSSMCRHILEAGYSVSVYNRTRSKAEALEKDGAVVCDSPAEVAKSSDVVFTIVGFPADVEQVILSEDGVIANLHEGGVIVDMTTSKPALAIEISKAATAAGKHALDAPVSGGDIGARNGTLAIMVGGEQKIFDACLPFFKLMGENIRLMGPAGSGQHCKMSNQILIAGTMIGVVESLLYAHKAGMDLDEVIDVIGSGAAGSWSINNLGRRIAQGDYNPGFYIKHFVKDMGIALEEARNAKLSLPGLALVHQFYVAAQALGHDDLGTQGLYKVCEYMNGMNG